MKTFKLPLLLLIIILYGNQNTYSQISSFKGRTIDYVTNNPIIGATIIDGNNSQNGTISDLDGNFELIVEGKTGKLEFHYLGCYPIKFINIPIVHTHINFGEIKLVHNHLMDNFAVGDPPSKLNDLEKQKEKDKRLRKNVLKMYRIKIPGKKLKPYFDDKYLVFDFNTKNK